MSVINWYCSKSQGFNIQLWELDMYYCISELQNWQCIRNYSVLSDTVKHRNGVVKWGEFEFWRQKIIFPFRSIFQQ